MKARIAHIILLGAASLAGYGQLVYTVDTLELRPAGEDFAPVLVDSGLVFTSVRYRAQAVAFTNKETGKPLADLYRVRLHAGKPGHPKLMEGTLCSRFNDGPATFSTGGDTICFTRNTSIGKRRQAGNLGLIFAVMQGGSWSEPVPFAHNGEEFATLNPSFSSDGQALYFASNRPGGHGGLDLYVSRRNGTEWSAPRNLGPEVNTMANESWPTALAHDRLVFASNREGGMGKLDLYSTGQKYGEWTIAKPLPAPVNSPGNDLGYAACPDGRSGYFSSDRSGKDRIFSFTRKPAPFRNCAEQEPISYCYHFEDATAADADTLPLGYEWNFGDGTKLAAQTADHCFSGPGTYTVKLNLIDTMSESVYFNQVSYQLEVAEVEQAYINALDSIGTGQLLVLDTSHTHLPGFTTREVRWDFGDGIFINGDSAAHHYALAGMYTIRLDLIGGPDGKGDFVNHCVTRTVKVIEGLPSPASPQAMPTGTLARMPVQDAPAPAAGTSGGNATYAVQLLASKERISLGDARFLPIRPFYPVVERFVPTLSNYTYSIGSGSTPLSLYGAYQLAKRSNFPACEVKTVDTDKVLDLERLDQLPLEALNNGVLSFSTIRFKTGESAFDPSFNPTLDKVATVLLKYAEVNLVIEAHTDNVGREESNLKLSAARAQGIKDYFTQQGIAASRLRPIGLGENRPCTSNATAAGRAKNRRVEFHLSVRNPSYTAHP